MALNFLQLQNFKKHLVIAKRQVLRVCLNQCYKDNLFTFSVVPSVIKEEREREIKVRNKDGEKENNPDRQSERKRDIKKIRQRKISLWSC